MIITFDVETTGLHHKKDSLLSLSYLYGKCEGDATYPFETYYTTTDIYSTFDLMIDMFPNAVYIGHNIKFDLRFLDIHPDTVDKLNIIDTTILYHYLFPRNEKKLGSIEKHLFGTEQKNTYLEKFGKDFSLWPKEELERYNKLDVEITYRIYKKLINHVDQNFLEYQTNYLKALYRIEYYGIGFDQTMATVEETTTTVLAETKEKGLRTWITDNYGYDVSKLNFNSSKQLSNLLYVDLDIPRPDRNDYPSGKAFDKLFTSTLTNADLLETMKHPFVNLFLEWKKVIAVSKSIQTYAELAHDNRIYPSFNITGTITGRLSCSQPNLQNIAKDKKGLPSVRTLFRPDKDQTLVSIDYQQQEIRMLAILSGDENLLSLVKQGVDMHTVVGKQMFRKEEISKSERDVIKNIHFA